RASVTTITSAKDRRCWWARRCPAKPSNKQEQPMDIHPAGARPSRRAPKENFTGTVWQDPIITQQAPARLVANRVAFEPGARTAWHSPPPGQTLYITSGVGRVQTKGGPVREIKAGDVVWIPPGEKHWH